MAAVGPCGTGTGSTGSVAAAASKNNVTSFQRRGPRASSSDSGGSRLVSIAGTRPSVRNGQLLVSTGLPALDQLLGGGLAVGTVLLIDLAPSEFWLFPKVKMIQDIEAATTAQLRTLTKEDFQNCFRKWQEPRDKCVQSEGEYFEGD
ncbi:elongator acetyltransferase complex subunit 4 [Rhinolophus ferrumequinum]|uniref:Elongator complex protein 4 n=1 Tax=Rhinolophus ferrumequinum TaxID=59479 RepID=A0A7J7W6X6_RHIFE|nr:elongator acetyltransferase complex subunit 4 [Rhinolophus ferrumequinum]